jgi:transcriptional regulator with XRE-family HTH domain
MISEAKRIRIIRAILGWETRELAAKVGVTPGTVTGWEHGRSVPQRAPRMALNEICRLQGIAIMPSGYPMLTDDLYEKVEGPAK